MVNRQPCWKDETTTQFPALSRSSSSNRERQRCERSNCFAFCNRLQHKSHSYPAAPQRILCARQAKPDAGFIVSRTGARFLQRIASLSSRRPPPGGPAWVVFVGTAAASF